MPEPAIAPAFVPRKPVASADDRVQSVLLTVVVSDHESVAELLQKTEGRERDEYALTSLRIGILALKHARGQIDADAVKREGERLLVDLKSALDQSRNDIHSNLTNALKEYFDPQSGRASPPLWKRELHSILGIFLNFWRRIDARAFQSCCCHFRGTAGTVSLKR
jgi:hypothetical protein